MPEAVLDLMEPGAKDLAPEIKWVEAEHLIPLASIAISLKRLADAVQGDPKNNGITDYLRYIAEGKQS